MGKQQKNNVKDDNGFEMSSMILSSINTNRKMKLQKQKHKSTKMS